MDEQRMNAYVQLIQKLLQCSTEEEGQILINDNSNLLDPGLLQTIITVAEEFDDNANQNMVNFLTNLALQLGEWLGSGQQPTAIRKQTADILLQWGIKQCYMSQFMRVLDCLQHCLSIYQAIQDRRGEVGCLGVLATAYHSLGETEKAITFYEQFLAINREFKYREGEDACLGALGKAYGSLGEYERAITFYEQSLAIKREIKDRQGEADCLGVLGKAYGSLGEYERAITFYEQSLAIKREIKDRQGEADCLGVLGMAYGSLREYERAITFYEQSLAISREIKDRQGEAHCLGNLGNTYCYLGEYERAITFYEEYLVIKRGIKDRQGEADCLGNLGNTYCYLGEYERAITFHEQHLAISREIKYRQREANSLENLGSVYYHLGEYEQAITFHEQHLTISREIKDRKGEATSLGHLGNPYWSLGEYERAITFHEQSLAISREIKDRKGEAISLGSLGNTYHHLGEVEKAITFYEQHLTISREIKDREGEATSLGNLGNTYLSLGEYERAITFYEQYLAISRKIKYRQGEAISLGDLGNAYLSLGEYERAITFYEQYLAISREIKYRHGEVVSLGGLGGAYHSLGETEKAIHNYRDSLKIATPETIPPVCFIVGRNFANLGFTQGNWQLALEGYEPAMQAVEQLRKGSTTDQRRQEIIADAFSVYANAVQCYINLKQYDKAVETADRSRSRHLADLFYSKDLYPQGEIPPEVAEYYRLQEQSDRFRFSDNDGTKAFATTRQATPNGDIILEKIKELETEKQKAWLKIRSKDPVLAGQLQADPLNFQQMQTLIPDAETAILNFYTTPEHTHIFILRKNQPPQLHTCEGQGLETLQNSIFDNWLKPYKENKTAWKNQISEFLPELANRLQINQLISEHLNGIKELIIIPHLYLHQIPFAALPLNHIPIPNSNTTSDTTRGTSLNMNKTPDTSAKTPPQQPEYLSNQFRIRIVPSCQILNYCHQRDDLKPETMGIVENARGDLIFTGYECETLATLHNVKLENRLKYDQATISNYQQLPNQVQVLHSSHHASSQLDNPLESKLHLFDGDVNLGRIFTWRFANLAEVFLSCCETNLTLTQITDDPLSIAAGFLCAGARNVVSTLWAVDDLATALFCILYYQEKQDKSRSEAIRKAQFKLRNLTGDQLYANYKQQLEAYFEQQNWGENQAEMVKIQRLRLDLLCRERLPFVSPQYWAGFVSQGLA
ncbi:tetratricopeptide repeat protein [Planktothrix sp. FACHB-1365]|uniref:CHAT domain-containing protein n=1 Tax=Planktothrix sp. FACHB-1365 TaxID=2692855 RepID=UPI001686C58F|nr:tetratricopeptide repeat protein [Planktothrix sp. FACHB-1365]MBD2481162.1 tetratricopeptide repeat protein [Planktothrix sp. FACHB-1365]